MKTSHFYVIVPVLGALLSGACEAKKSSNPLSPTVAGPIPGVEISVPITLEPANGSRIPVDKQPITFLIQNAGTSGVRPLTYTLEIAVDAEFATKVFTRENIAPGSDGRTSLRMADALATGHTYYWRVRAEDGANASAPAPPARFDIYTPIVIDAPPLISPATNVTVPTTKPDFRIDYAPRNGPVGPISYLIEVSDTFSFATKSAAWTAAEGTGAITLILPAPLQSSKTYFWHVRAFDATTTGPWSEVRAFVTPAEAPAPGPGGGGGGGVPVGPVAADAFNLAAAVVHSSPSGVASWPATTAITSLSFRSDGVAVEFSKKSGAGRWPDVLPPGWSGTLQYTLWIAMNIGGQWHTCGPIEYWFGLAAQGGDVTAGNQIAANWTYYCGPMARQPAPGEQVGFFVTAGDQRLKDIAVVHERSNVVVVSFPATAGRTFTF